jgi:hypothetical protein
MVRAVTGVGAVIHLGDAWRGMSLVHVMGGMIVLHVVHGVIHHFMLCVVFPLLLFMFNMVVHTVLVVVLHMPSQENQLEVGSLGPDTPAAEDGGGSK